MPNDCRLLTHCELNVSDLILNLHRSCFKGQLRLPLLHRQGWVRQSMARGAQKGQALLCDERDEQGSHHNEAKCQVSYQ